MTKIETKIFSDFLRGLIKTKDRKMVHDQKGFSWTYVKMADIITRINKVSRKLEANKGNNGR